jgi:hypothetical protein
MRWIVSIVLSVAFAAGIVLAYQGWMDFRTSQAEIEFLKQEMRNYQKVERMYAEQEEKVVVVNALWEEIQDVGLAPANWLQYPLSIGRTMNWRDLERLLFLASNDPETGGYWFEPKLFRVTRVVVAPEGGGEGGENAGLPRQMYETVMQGQFMIPKKK